MSDYSALLGEFHKLLKEKGRAVIIGLIDETDYLDIENVTDEEIAENIAEGLYKAFEGKINNIIREARKEGRKQRGKK